MTKADTQLEIPEYNATEIENKWREVWEKEKIYQPDLDTAKKPFYNLMMFPYPSAEGLHVGSVFTFSGVDTYGRFKRMQGYDVFQPMGLDGFGIHSENYALKVGKHPIEQAKISEKNFYRQLSSIGNGFDWSRKLETYDPNYYKWTQWLFIQLFKRGLAYRKKAAVNFCPKDLTVLADEQVIDGKCERCSAVVEKRDLEQWFFKITDYAERLLKNIPDLNWTEKVKIAQKEWIGKKEGVNIKYSVILERSSVKQNEAIESQRSYQSADAFFQDDKTTIEVFTTRPDTNFGATFIALAPEHPLVGKITTPDQKNAVEDYVQVASGKSDIERGAENREKTGVFTGSYAVNQLTGYKMPIWISDFVLAGFGTGALVGVPGHDKRDFAFAKKFDLEIKRVVVGSDGDTSPIEKIEQVQEAEGTMVNSDFLDGVNIHEATEKIMDYMEEKGYGKRVTTYHLRDWLISRQRYWGPPIPMVFCSSCAEKDLSYSSSDPDMSGESRSGFSTSSNNMAGWFPVSDDQLPVLLPEVEDWKPKGSGASPLANIEEFVNTTCPKCGGKARRETDVSDTFLDSAWYFLRYLFTEFDDIPFGISTDYSLQTTAENPEAVVGSQNAVVRAKKWLPVHMYIGGAEHSVLHLLYSRFITMFFHDMGLISHFEEPYARFYAHGLIIKDGAKMSKSKGNVINPDEYVAKYGADTLRTYLRFVGPFDMGGDFRDSGIEGMERFLKRVWRLIANCHPEFISGSPSHGGASSRHREMLNQVQHDNGRERLFMMHKTIKKVTEDMEGLRFNTAVAALMEYYNFLSDQEGISREEADVYVRLLAPIAPFMAEELWQGLQGTEETQETDVFRSVHKQSWPSFDNKYLISDVVTIVVQINGKMRASLEVESGKLKDHKEIEDLARKDERVAKHLAGNTIQKVIYIPGKVINFVTA